jgi:hypothetical protein
MGRQMQERRAAAPGGDSVAAFAGTDGSQKMSKTAGIHIPLDDAPIDMYSKVLSIPDAAMLLYFELLTDVSLRDLAAIREALAWWAKPDMTNLPLGALDDKERQRWTADPSAFPDCGQCAASEESQEAARREIVATRHGMEAAAVGRTRMGAHSRTGGRRASDRHARARPSARRSVLVRK